MAAYSPIQCVWLAACCIASVAQARAADAVLPWDGVWQGTVGDAQVRMCLQHASYGGASGVYYYKRYLRLIALTRPNAAGPDERTLVLNETMALPQRRTQGGENKKSGEDVAVWTLSIGASLDVLEGAWRSTTKTWPVRLSRIPNASPQGAANEDGEGPCESDAFNSPREEAAKLLASDAKLKGLGTAYRDISLDLGDRFPSRISGFELLRDDDAARHFNVVQRHALLSEQREVFGCTRNVIGRYGQSGDYDRVIEPVFIGRHWVVSSLGGGDDCGGAHPNAYRSYSTWSLDERREINPWGWFNAQGAVVTRQGAGDSQYLLVELGAALRAALSKAWPRRGHDDCASIIDDGFAFSWVAYPSTRGMAFMPKLPHVVYACTEEVTLPWQQVMPMLNGAGRKAANAVRADMKRPPAR